MSEKPNDQKKVDHQEDDEPKTPTKKDLKSLESEQRSPLGRVGDFLRKSMKFKKNGSPKEKIQAESNVYIKWISFDNRLSQNSHRVSAATTMNQGNQKNRIETSPGYHQCGRTPPNTPVEGSVNGDTNPYRNSRNENQSAVPNQDRRFCPADFHLRLEYLSGNSTISATSSYSSYGKDSSSGDPNSMFSPGQKRQPATHSHTHRSKCLTYCLPSKNEWEESSTSSDESFNSPK